MSQFGIKEWIVEVSRGNVPGAQIWRAFGERISMGITTQGEDIWRGTAAEVPIPSGAGERMTLVSSNDADNGATDTGAQTVEIHYLDGSNNEQIEIVTLNGTTPVITVATDITFINKIHSRLVGSNGVAEGNIIIHRDGEISTVFSLIVAGGNQSMLTNRKVPANKKLFLMEWHAEEAQSKRVAFRIRSTDSDGELLPGTFIFKGVAYLKQSTSAELDVRVMIPSLSIIKITGYPAQTGAEGSAGWWGILIND